MPGEPDVVGGHPEARSAKERLALLDGFPPFLDRREVPLRATETHRPEASLRCIEGNSPPDREVFHDIVGAESSGAEQARAVHRSRLATLLRLPSAPARAAV